MSGAETVELKPCPFCGGQQIAIAPQAEWWTVICKACGSSCGTCDAEAEAIAAWNTRTQADALSVMRKAEGALRNIDALARKVQDNAGPNGNMAHVQGFAAAALDNLRAAIARAGVRDGGDNRTPLVRCNP